MTDEKTLRFIHARLIRVHGENPSTDYMVGLSKAIDNLSAPLSSIGRDRIIEIIREVYVKTSMKANQIELIADAILKEGVPGKEDKKCSTHCDWPDCTLPECHQRQIDPNWNSTK